MGVCSSGGTPFSSYRAVRYLATREDVGVGEEQSQGVAPESAESQAAERRKIGDEGVQRAREDGGGGIPDGHQLDAEAAP